MDLSVQHDGKYLEKKPIGGLLLKFALPCVIAMLVNSLYNIVDQIFIGQGVGYLGNGATNVVFPITVAALALALLIGDGAAAFYSLKMGEKKPEEAHKGVGNALVLLAAIGVLFALFALIFLDELLSLFGSTDLIRPYAVQYGGIVVLGIPFVLVGTGANSMIRASGNPSYAMKSMLLGAAINTVLDTIFIFPLRMGVAGAAIATVIGQVATFWMSLSYLLREGNPVRRRENFIIDRKISLACLGCGVSSFINQIAISVSIVVVNHSLAAYGAESVYGAEIPLTSVGIVMKVNQVIMSILVGIAVGSQPIIGYNYGAGNLRRVRQTLGFTQGVATCVSCLAFVLFVFFPEPIIALFGSGDELYSEFSRKAFGIFLMLCLLNGFQVTSGVFFQAVGKPLKAAVISLSRQVIVFIPLVVLLPRYLGVDGVLYAGPIADGIAFFIAFALIAREVSAMRLSSEPGAGVLPALASRESARLAP